MYCQNFREKRKIEIFCLRICEEPFLLHQLQNPAKEGGLRRLRWSSVACMDTAIIFLVDHFQFLEVRLA